MRSKQQKKMRALEPGSDRRPAQKVAPVALRPFPLTDQQLRILDLSSQGYKQTDIADQLDISVWTVKFHTRLILARTGARNTFHAWRLITHTNLQPQRRAA